MGAAGEVIDMQLRSAIELIVGSANQEQLSELTQRGVREQLAATFKCDLSRRKKFVSQCVKDVIGMRNEDKDDVIYTGGSGAAAAGGGSSSAPSSSSSSALWSTHRRKLSNRFIWSFLKTCHPVHMYNLPRVIGYV